MEQVRMYLLWLGLPGFSGHSEALFAHGVTPVLLASSGNLFPDSPGVKRQADQGGSTAHAALAVFCSFQKHCLIHI
jgi:hypothetical protein